MIAGIREALAIAGFMLVMGLAAMALIALAEKVL